MLVNNVGVLQVEEPMTVTESDVVDVLETTLKHDSSDITTRAMSLIAVLKLSSHFPSTSQRIQEIVLPLQGNIALELQQRAIEFNNIILKHQNIKSALVERMPILDESIYIRKRAGSSQASLSSDKTSAPSPVEVSLKPPEVPLVDLLDLSCDDTSFPASNNNDVLRDLLGLDLTAPMSSANTDMLMDLLSIGGPVEGYTPISIDSLDQGISPSSNASPASIQVLDLLDGLTLSASLSNNSDSPDPVYPSITAFQSSSLKITFSFTKQHKKPHVTIIEAIFTNLSADIYTEFILQAAVPKFIQLHLDPASSNFLPAGGNSTVTQTLTITNTQHGKKALAMRIRICYKVNNEERLECGQINNFPDGL